MVDSHESCPVAEKSRREFQIGAQPQPKPPMNTDLCSSVASFCVVWHRCVRGLLVRSSGFSLYWVRAAWRL